MAKKRGLSADEKKQKMLEAMNDVATIQRNMFALSQKLSSTCYAFNARAARYKKAANG